MTQIACEAFEEADDVFGLAAELRAQLGFLGSDAGGAGVEVTLARHVAADRDEHRGTESKFIRAEHGGDQDIARGLKTTIAAQTHAAAKAFGKKRLLRLREAQLPGIACVLDAGERRCAGSAAVAGDDDVVREGFGDAGRDGADAKRGDQLDPDGSAGIDALEVVDELRQVFDRVDVMVRRRTDEHDAGLRVAETCDQLRDFVRRELAAFARLRALRDLDLDLFRVSKVLGGDAKASGGELLDLVVVQAATAGERIGRPHGRILATFTGVRTCTEDIHRLGDRAMRLGTERAKRHGRGDEAARDLGCRLNSIFRQGRTCRANVRACRAASVARPRRLR